MTEIERPNDHEIMLYINDLELALADAGVLVTTNSERLKRVHGWAARLGARAELLTKEGLRLTAPTFEPAGRLLEATERELGNRSYPAEESND